MLPLSMEQKSEKYDCLSAFTRGHRLNAKLLLPRSPTPVPELKTTFKLSPQFVVASLVSLLHLAAYHGWLNITTQLITKHKCEVNSKDSRGRVPIHYAAYTGHLEILKYLIDEHHCDPMSRDMYGSTPLHFACANDHLDVAQYLTVEQNCDPSCVTFAGNTPLHFACNNGHLKITQYLISEKDCNPSSISHDGWTPLHLACNIGELNLTKYLVDTQCDTSCVDNVGWTPLHFACNNGHTHIVKYLLSTGRVDPMIESAYGITPVSLANQTNNGYDILKLFHPFEQCKQEFPVHTYTKVVLTGDSGAGKTTIARLISLLTSTNIAKSGLDDILKLTAGVIPHVIDSRLEEISGMVVYDFAGQQEYYASQSAILEHVTRKSSAIFICAVDVSLTNDKICDSVRYWIQFIENACNLATKVSHIVALGSHADLVNPPETLKDKILLIEKVAVSSISHLRYMGSIVMDCHQLDADSTQKLVCLLSASQKSILKSQPSMSFYCHSLYAFFRSPSSSMLMKNGCTLQELASALATEDNPSLPSDPIILTDFLESLSDKALIMFLKNNDDLLSSWVVVETDGLLNEVIGTLFAPSYYDQHHIIASNTGIVHNTTLHETFPKHNTKMIVQFLQSMEICQPVKLSALQDTNITVIDTSHMVTADDELFFFPGLVKESRPDNLPLPKFGWCLGCSETHQFFSARFVHVLLLRLAFTHSLTSKHLPPSSIYRGLQRRCQVWQSGISWINVFGVTTIVEFLDRNQWVMVLVSESSKPAAHTCSSVIRMILDLHKELCKFVAVCECLISPSLLTCYPFTSLSNNKLFDITDVARSIILHQKLILDRAEGIEQLETEEIASFEPYYLLRPSSVHQLLNTNMDDQPIPNALLHEVFKHCHPIHKKPQFLKELRDLVNESSIFAGRDPMRVAELKNNDIIQSDQPGGATSVATTNLDIDDLLEVVEAVCDLTDWKKLGLVLGLRYPTLKKIENDRQNQVDDCKLEMLAAWLQQQDNVPQIGTPSWTVLQAALKRIGEKEF